MSDWFGTQCTGVKKMKIVPIFYLLNQEMNSELSHDTKKRLPLLLAYFISSSLMMPLIMQCNDEG